MHGPAEFSMRLDPSNYEPGIQHILASVQPEWKTECITYDKITVGLTNTLVCVGQSKPEEDGCNQKEGQLSQKILFRIYGDGTDVFIDRDAEKRIMQIMYRAGRACPLLATFQNGLVYGFMPGTTVTKVSVRAPHVYPLIAAELATIHRIRPDDYTGAEAVSLWASLQRMMQNAPTEFADPARQSRFASQLRAPAELRAELQQLRRELEALGSPVVLCHNDVLLDNILLAPDHSRVRLIDFEYGGFNHQAYDIANHFNEYAGTEGVDYGLLPGRDYQLAWLRCYLETYLSTEPGPEPRPGPTVRRPTDAEVETLYQQVRRFALLSHFYWGYWALVQTRFSQIDFDYLEYAIIRFHEYDRERELLAAAETHS